MSNINKVIDIIPKSAVTSLQHITGERLG